jgi:hypothetical protein
MVGQGISLVMRSPLLGVVDFSGCELVRRLCRILLHFLFALKVDGIIFCSMIGVTAMVHAVWRFIVYGPRPRLQPQFEALPLLLYCGDL